MLGEELRSVLHTLPDVLQTQATFQSGMPKLWVETGEEEARLAGLSLMNIAEQVQGNLEGQLGGSVLEDTEELLVRIRYPNVQRGDTQRLASARLVTPGSDYWLPLSALADLTLKPEPGSLTRRDGERCTTVNAFIRSDALPPEVNRMLLDRLTSEISLPPGYQLEVGGDAEEQATALAKLTTYVPVLLILMVATLVLAFRSFALGGLLGFVAVLSVGWGLLSIWVSGYSLGFNPILGAAGLIGVSFNDSIVVLAAIRGNPRASAGDPQAIVDELTRCTRHVLSTTLTTIGRFLSLILGGGDFWSPLAVVIAGGVGGATLIALVFVPTAYLVLLRLIPSLRTTVVRGMEGGAESLGVAGEKFSATSLNAEEVDVEIATSLPNPLSCMS